VDPRTDLDDMEKRKLLTPPGLELRHLGSPAHGQSLYRLRSPSSYRAAQTQKKRTETTMPQVRFKPTISPFVRAKTVHVLNRAATMIGTSYKYNDCILVDEETVN
jgi:hypothetical protein